MGGAGEDRGSSEGDHSGGTGDEHRDSGDAPATDWTDDIDDIRRPIGEQLSQVVAKVPKDKGKKFTAKEEGNTEVLRVIHARFAAEKA